MAGLQAGLHEQKGCERWMHLQSGQLWTLAMGRHWAVGHHASANFDFGGTDRPCLLLQVLTPALTLFVTLCFGLERFSWPLGLSVTLMSAGTAAATVVETGMPGFAWQGFGAFMLSATFESIRVVLIQLLLGQLQFNAVEILVYLGPPTGALLLAAAAIWEQDAFFGPGLSLMAHKPVLYTAAILLGVGVNLTTAVAIKATSSLTFKVFGCIKNTLVVVVGVLLGDRLAPEQMLGYAVSVAGFGLYTYAKQQTYDLRRSPKKAQ